MKVKFKNPPSTSDSLQSVLRKRVNQYFKANNLSKKGNWKIWTKAFILLASYVVPYLLILILPMPPYLMFLLVVLMGFAYAGIGMSIMHDACHGAFSKNPQVNSFLGYSMNLIGGNKFNWMVQHNVKHHTYTNIFGADEDLDNGDVIRLSPYSKWSKIHRYQHIYSWFLYLLGTLSWVTIKDFRQFRTLYKEQATTKEEFSKELKILILSKILYYIYMVVIPLLVLDVPWWYILIGFLTIHFIAGFVLTVTFQLAHIVEMPHHDTIEQFTEMPDSWIAHQIKTTANFSRKSALLNWYLGGLNFQIEHHLFPQISHIHYKDISEIVKQTVQEYGLSYYEHSSMRQAVSSHYRTLRKFSLPTEKPF